MRCFSLLNRSFSTSCIVQELVKAPIQVYGVEGRYASALYSAASKTKTLDSAEKDLKEIKHLLKSDVLFRDFITDPTIQKEAKLEALEVVASKKKLGECAKNMLTAMTENRRLNKLGGIATIFEALMAAHRGEVVCEVTTAKPLDGAMKAELEKSLNSFLKKGEVLKYSTKVDPEIIGGMKVTIGDKYVDMSIATKIKKYSDVISAPL